MGNPDRADVKLGLAPPVQCDGVDRHASAPCLVNGALDRALVCETVAEQHEAGNAVRRQSAQGIADGGLDICRPARFDITEFPQGERAELQRAKRVPASGRPGTFGIRPLLAELILRNALRGVAEHGHRGIGLVNAPLRSRQCQAHCRQRQDLQQQADASLAAVPFPSAPSADGDQEQQRPDGLNRHDTRPSASPLGSAPAAKRRPRPYRIQS